MVTTAISLHLRPHRHRRLLLQNLTSSHQFSSIFDSDDHIQNQTSPSPSQSQSQSQSQLQPQSSSFFSFPSGDVKQTPSSTQQPRTPPIFNSNPTASDASIPSLQELRKKLSEKRNVLEADPVSSSENAAKPISREEFHKDFMNFDSRRSQPQQPEVQPKRLGRDEIRQSLYMPPQTPRISFLNRPGGNPNFKLSSPKEVLIEKTESGDEVVEVSGTAKNIEQWPMKDTEYFIDLMEEEAKKGNRVNTTFTRQSWSLILTKLIEKTGYTYTHLQLKNKYNYLRQEYRCCKMLCEESGMTRDPATNMFYASDELWQRLFKVNKFAKRFKRRGCMYYDKLCTIFGDTTATGANPHPLTRLPSKLQDDVVNVEETHEEKVSENEQKRQTQGRWGDGPNNTLRTFIEGLGAEARKWTEAIEKLASTLSGDSSVRGGVGVGVSLVGTREIDSIKPALDCLENLDVYGPAYGKAFTKIREDPIWREMFMSIGDARKVDVVMSLI